MQPKILPIISYWRTSKVPDKLNGATTIWSNASFFIKAVGDLKRLIWKFSFCVRSGNLFLQSLKVLQKVKTIESIWNLYIMYKRSRPKAWYSNHSCSSNRIPRFYSKIPQFTHLPFFSIAFCENTSPIAINPYQFAHFNNANKPAPVHNFVIKGLIANWLLYPVHALFNNDIWKNELKFV